MKLKITYYGIARPGLRHGTHTYNKCTHSQPKFQSSPPFSVCPPCLKISGLAPDLPAPINRQVVLHDLPFILALHTIFVSVSAARKIHDQNTPKLFPKLRVDSLSQGIPMPAAGGTPTPHPRGTDCLAAQSHQTPGGAIRTLAPPPFFTVASTL